MKAKKRLLAAMMIIAVSLGVLSGCGADSGSEQPSADGVDGETTVLKMGHVYAEDYPMHLAMQQMSDYIWPLSD